MLGRGLLLAVVLCVLLAGGAAGGTSKGPPPEPKVGPIVAVFRPADFATYYSIDITPVAGRKLDVTWVLDAPKEDPGCKLFHQSATNPDMAVWKHGDQDGCDHSKMVAVGHDGFVHAFVSDGAWNCEATYHGTISGTGKPADCHSELAHDVESAIIHARLAEEQAEEGNNVDANLRKSLADLDTAIGLLGEFPGAAAAQAAADLRRAKVDDRLAQEIPSQSKSELKKAIALKHKAELLVVGHLR